MGLGAVCSPWHGQNPRWYGLTHIYAPNFEEVDGAYWFRVVRACVRPSVHACNRPSVHSWTMHAMVLKFHIWIPHGKIFDTRFFLSELSPFLELCPIEKIRTKSDACHILWTVHARVLKFHIWISHGKIADLYFFLVRVISLSGVMPLWKNQHEILSARYLKKYLS